MKDEPGKDSGRHAFEREEQRSRRRIGPRKTGHEQQGANNTARHDSTGEPWHVCSTKGLLD